MDTASAPSDRKGTRRWTLAAAAGFLAGGLVVFVALQVFSRAARTRGQRISHGEWWLEGSFSLAYLVRNTIMNLTTQAAQVACFRKVAAHLEPGGRFVVEVMVPALQRLPPGDIFHVFRAEKDYWGIDEYDVVNQGLVSHHLEAIDGQVECFSVPFRFVWPSELDLMAELAGMGLRKRWSGWKREPFTSASAEHVSVWKKPET